MESTDIHMHCIPSVDDGATNFEMALDMLKQSYDQGVRNVFCTSHSSAYDYEPGITLERFNELKQKTKEVLPDMELYLGCEVLCYPELMDEVIQLLDDGTYPTMNGTKFVLIEFDFDDTKAQFLECADRLIEAGYTPIIAHVERYYNVWDDFSILTELKRRGCYLQINAYSVKQDSKVEVVRTANMALSEGLVDFIGTDAHRTNHRPPEMFVGVGAIFEQYGIKYSSLICGENASLYLLGDK